MFRITILHPDFTWHTVPSVEDQQRRLPSSADPPPTRRVAPYFIRRILAPFHNWLVDFSIWYCRWCEIQCPGQIWPLPFGLLLKWSDGTRLEEVVAMRMARDAGLPVPRVISYADHPDKPHAPVSILMTRMPGAEFQHLIWDWYSKEKKAIFIEQLKMFLATIRSWSRVRSGPEPLICSAAGTTIRSVRVPEKSIGPCPTIESFNAYLIEPALGPSVHERFDDHDELCALAATINTMHHEIKFTHGDLAHHNFLVLPDGRISLFGLGSCRMVPGVLGIHHWLAFCKEKQLVVRSSI